MGAHSTVERPSQTQCSVWLWSGEEEAGRAPACGTSHDPCQPHSTGVGGLGQEAQSKITCCQLRCTTLSGINLHVCIPAVLEVKQTMHKLGSYCCQMMQGDSPLPPPPLSSECAGKFSQTTAPCQGRALGGAFPHGCAAPGIRHTHVHKHTQSRTHTHTHTHTQVETDGEHTTVYSTQAAGKR